MGSSRRTRGCRLFVAAAGYGKTTAAEAIAPSTMVWSVTATSTMVGPMPTPAGPTSPADCAGPADGTVHVIVDSLGEMPAATLRRLGSVLATTPDEVLVSLCARGPLAARALAALPTPIVEHTAADLALTPDAVARVLRDGYGIVDADLAYLVHDLTGGWPALVHFAAEVASTAEAVNATTAAEAGRATVLDALTAPGAACATWTREQALAGLPPGPARLLRLLADLDPVSVGLCLELANATGDDDARHVHSRLSFLIRAGFLSPHPEQTDPERTDPEAVGLPSPAEAGGPWRVVPVIAAVLGREGSENPTAERTRRDQLRVAAAWYTARGQPLAAANLLRRIGDRRAWCELVQARGDDMLAAGGAAVIAAGVAAHLRDTATESSTASPPSPGPPSPGPASPRTASPREPEPGGLRLLLGDALRMTGDVVGALRTFDPLVAAADRHGCWSAALAWRVAMVHYMRSDYRTAWQMCQRVCESADAADPSTSLDSVFLETCRASVLTMLGDAAAAQAHAALALELADTVGIVGRDGADRALAAAHIAVALTSLGVRREAHLAHALAAATRAGDVVASARVLVNQADGSLRQAHYVAALAVAARAVRAAQRGSPPGLVAVALCNAGEALLRLGRYDEAELHFDRTVLISRRCGLNRTAMGLWGLAEIDRLLGRRARSRSRFDEAVELARATEDNQVLVPALAGLARVLLDDGAPDAARAAADEAEQVAPALLAPRALVARGWVALADGDLGLAQLRAVAAVAAARQTRRSDSLAEALELAAFVATDHNEARAMLVEAEDIWRRAGAAPAADQTIVLLGRLPSSDGGQRAAAKSAAARLQALGITAVGGSSLLPGAAAPVRVRVLGRFEVLVAGKPVPLTAWRSRQARSLLKILVSQRGSPIARAELAELLWPDDDAQRTGHRLSVLLSAVRAVLDPARLWPVDHHVRADIAGISLDTEHVASDVEDLIHDAHHAAALVRDGDHEHARDVLIEVDAMYSGDAFSDEPYEEWSSGLREQARAVWLRSLRTLADLSRDAGDTDQAVTCLVRLLAADSFDEKGHAALVTLLVRAGRHGEARRAFDRWTQAMRTIDAPAPDHRLLRPVDPVATT